MKSSTTNTYIAVIIIPIFIIYCLTQYFLTTNRLECANTCKVYAPKIIQGTCYCDTTVKNPIYKSKY